MGVATGSCLQPRLCPLLRCILIVAVYSCRSLSSSDRDGNLSASPSPELSTSLPSLMLEARRVSTNVVVSKERVQLFGKGWVQ